MTGDQLELPPSALDPAELHQAARAYCRLGWSIIPAAAEGKRALVAWKRWQAQAPDTELVDRWWRRWPAANIAVITGRVSGLVVVDVDPRHEGEWTFEDLQADHGPIPWRAVARTPSGGWHVYLQHPRFRVANSASRFGAGLTCAGTAGWSWPRRAAGTWTPTAGRSAAPGTVPPMPNGWRRLLRPPRPRPPSPPHTWSEPEGRDAARLAGLVRQVARAPERQRNNTLYWAGRRLAEMVAEGAPAGWRAELERTGLDAGLGVREVVQTLDSALGKQQP